MPLKKMGAPLGMWMVKEKVGLLLLQPVSLEKHF
jgi:hypothetical protein